jgi:hypothetical protein
MGEGPLRRFLNLCDIMIFRSLLIRGNYDFPYKLCSSGNFSHGLYRPGIYRFLFIYLFKLASSRFLKCNFFIKGHIPCDLNMAVTRYVDSEGFGYLTVSYKYSLLFVGFQLVSFLFQYMDKHWTTKYFEMAYLGLLSSEHFFWGLEPKCTMG